MRKAPPSAPIRARFPGHRTWRLAHALAVILVACKSTPATAPVVVPTPIVRGALPPIPLVEGPLAPKLVYPQANQLIQSKDSTFVLGSVGNGRASLTINGIGMRVESNGAFLGYIPNPPPTAPQYDLVAVLGGDTARATQPVRVAGITVPGQNPDSTRILPPPPPPTVVDTTPTWVVLGDSVNLATDTDRVVIGRPAPNETYRWFLMPGTRVQLTARYPGYARVRLDSALQIWVQAVDARTFAVDTSTPKRVAGNSRVRCTPDWCDLMIPINERPPYFVQEHERALELTLYDTRGNTDLVDYPTSDSLIKHVEWAQERSDRVRYTVQLSRTPFGYLVLYDAGFLTLRVRRPPALLRASTERPLSGITIAVDPGHPPSGATGPTGLYEAEAVLPVGFMLKQMLEEKGATVVMTRTTRDPVDLALRPVIARRAGAHAFVSMHYNAYGDGTNPLRQPNGIETYFYQPHSEPLARLVQNDLITRQPLDDQGVHFRSLAVVRTPWMPAILAEGGYIIIPAQENAMRTQEFQSRYARAIADGLESFFRALRAPPPSPSP
ncbi:MAG TPA: N-acetylmuramoyl-L-alanine amidase [Gemmatimonadaceae bacterium]|nr:N-acetylmuramoyl-L-alanine amidase [Gemmatimonadaceae bacterium]